MHQESHEKIAEARASLLAFLNGGAKRMAFRVDCPLENRIEFIYRVIFPGIEKLWFYFRFFFARIASVIDYSPAKVVLYRMIGLKIGRGVFISPGVVIDPHFPRLIEIEDHVIIGWGTQLFTHEFTGARYTLGRIKIGRGAVIGGFSIIRGGVTIGSHAEVASTCIVYKDVPQNTCLDSVLLPNRALYDSYQKEKKGDGHE